MQVFGLRNEIWVEYWGCMYFVHIDSLLETNISRYHCQYFKFNASSQYALEFDWIYFRLMHF